MPLDLQPVVSNNQSPEHRPPRPQQDSGVAGKNTSPFRHPQKTPPQKITDGNPQPLQHGGDEYLHWQLLGRSAPKALRVEVEADDAADERNADVDECESTQSSQSKTWFLAKSRVLVGSSLRPMTARDQAGCSGVSITT